MNPPRVYMCSPSWTPFPRSSPYHPSCSSQCTSPKHPVSCIKPGLATRFLYDIIHVSMPFSQIPISLFPISKSLFPFKTFHSWAESSKVVSGGRCIHHLPRLLTFWLKALFLSINICKDWFCKQWTVGPDSFCNRWRDHMYALSLCFALQLQFSEDQNPQRECYPKLQPTISL